MKNIKFIFPLFFVLLFSSCGNFANSNKGTISFIMPSHSGREEIVQVPEVVTPTYNFTLDFTFSDGTTKHRTAVEGEEVFEPEVPVGECKLEVYAYVEGVENPVYYGLNQFIVEEGENPPILIKLKRVEPKGGENGYTITVNWNLDGGSWNGMQPAGVYKYYGLPIEDNFISPVKDGWKFKGWRIDTEYHDYVGVDFDESLSCISFNNVDRDFTVTITAVWEELIILHSPQQGGELSVSWVFVNSIDPDFKLSDYPLWKYSLNLKLTDKDNKVEEISLNSNDYYIGSFYTEKMMPCEGVFISRYLISNYTNYSSAEAILIVTDEYNVETQLFSGPIVIEENSKMQSAKTVDIHENLNHKFILTWNLNGGEWDGDEYPTELSSLVSENSYSNPKKDGYEFIGWEDNVISDRLEVNTDETGTKVSVFGLYDYGNMVHNFTAVWMKIPVKATNITVTPDYTMYESVSNAYTSIQYTVTVTFNNIYDASNNDLMFSVTTFGLAPYNGGKSYYFDAINDCNENGNFADYKYTGGAGFTTYNYNTEDSFFNKINKALTDKTDTNPGYEKTVDGNTVTYVFNLKIYKTNKECTSGDDWISATGISIYSNTNPSIVGYCIAGSIS